MNPATEIPTIWLLMEAVITKPDNGFGDGDSYGGGYGDGYGDGYDGGDGYGYGYGDGDGDGHSHGCLIGNSFFRWLE